MVGKSGTLWVSVGDTGVRGSQREGTVFLGEARQHTLDDKGRVALPSNLRPLFAGGCVITRGRDGCLWVFSESEWERVSGAFRELSTAQREVRNARRFFFGSASQLTPDGQGRIRVPASLREYANLSKDVVISGEADRLEIWDLAAWEALQQELIDSVESVSETIGLPI